MKKIILIFVLGLLSLSAWAQTDEEVAKANNPLADLKAINFQNYYANSLYEAPDDASFNQFVVRMAVPTGPILWRASIPFNTFGNGATGVDKSGLGDIDLFAAYLAANRSDFTFGIGPSAAFPSASVDDLPGTLDAWQLGVASVIYSSIAPQFQMGGLLIWRADVGGDDDVNLLAAQPFAFWQLGKGTYLRLAPIWQFDFERDTYSVPLGFGIGKVVKIGRTVSNIFIEPQYTILHDGFTPEFQIYTSLNLQIY